MATIFVRRVTRVYLVDWRARYAVPIGDRRHDVGRHDIGDALNFLDSSPSAHHAATEVAARLTAAGATELDERSHWDAASVRGFNLVRRDGAVIAWKLADSLNEMPAVDIVGAHTDSPCLKLKPRPDVGSVGWRQLAVEVYGGILNNSWLDRDLGLAGVVVDDAGHAHLVRTGPVARVPQLAVHLDRGVNDGLRLDPQTHLTPIWGLGTPEPGAVAKTLAALAGTTTASWWDISLFDVQPAALIGENREFIASGRLDNLISCWAATSALCETSTPTDRLALIVLNDHEEVGSASTTGADGPFLEHVLTRIASALGSTMADLHRALASSSCISADNAHAIHPNYPERHDAAHAPTVNAGPAIKVNVNQRYATSARSAQRFQHACETAEVPWQVFSSRNNVPCGSTIGPITATRLGIDTVDVGVPQLSMHSARELCGADDPAYLARAFTAYWSTRSA